MWWWRRGADRRITVDICRRLIQIRHVSDHGQLAHVRLISATVVQRGHEVSYLTWRLDIWGRRRQKRIECHHGRSCSGIKQAKPTVETSRIRSATVIATRCVCGVDRIEENGWGYGQIFETWRSSRARLTVFLLLLLQLSFTVWRRGRRARRRRRGLELFGIVKRHRLERLVHIS